MQQKIANLMNQQVVILTAIAADPTDRTVLREKMEVEDKLSKAQFEITKELLIRLLKLIEKSVLKQTESHSPYLEIQEEMRSMLNFSQGE